MKKSNVFLVVFMCFVMLSWNSYAETVRYVSDKLEVPLRAGKSLQHKILRMMPVGTMVKVLETDSEGYAKVSIGNLEGWVLSRYLMNKPAATSRLTDVEQDFTALEIEKNQLDQKIREINESQAKNTAFIEELKKENIRLQQDNANIRSLASNTLGIDTENRELKARILKLEREKDMVSQEASRLKNTASKDWFIYGAVVAVICILIGSLLPRMRPKRSSW